MDLSVIVGAAIGFAGAVVAAIVALRAQRGPLSYLAQLAPYVTAGEDGAVQLSRIIIAELAERWDRRKSRHWLVISSLSLAAGAALGLAYAFVITGPLQPILGFAAAILYFGGSLSLATAALVYYRRLPRVN